LTDSPSNNGIGLALQQALDAMSDIYVVYDSSWRFVFQNRAQREAMMRAGLDPDDAMGKVLWDVMPFLAGTAGEAGTRKAMAERVITEWEETYPPDLRLHGQAFPTPDGGVAVVARNVSEQWKAEIRHRAAAERTTALQTTAAAMATVMTVDRLAEVILSEGLAAAGADAGSVALLRDDMLHIIAYAGYEHGMVAPYEHFGINDPLPLADAARTGRAVVLNSADDFTSKYPHLSDAQVMSRGGARAAFPLVIDGRSLGAIGFNFPKGRILDDLDMDFLNALAQQCAQGIERARLYEAEREARATAERLQALAAAFSTALTAKAVGDVVLEHGVTATGATAGVLAMPAADSDEIEIMASSGYPPEACMGPGKRWHSDASIPIAEASRTGEPVFIRSTDEWAAHYPEAHAPSRKGNAAWAALPVSDGANRGALLWTFDGARQFDSDDISLMTTISDLCAHALERARLFEGEARMRVAAEEANRAKTEFLTMMSHELRTPLNAIGGYADLIQAGIRGPVSEDQMSDLERIKRSQRHLLSLINDVLNFAKLQAGIVQITQREFDLDSVASGVEALVTPQLIEKNISYRYTSALERCTCLGDPEKVEQILLNLLSNAIKFTDRGGRVSVGIDCDQHFAEVKVEDTGMGISEDKLAAVFEPFVQLNRTRTSGNEGTGLGLSISRDLARAMGGELSLKSKPGDGSTFTLRLPRVIATHSPKSNS
jgi:signal transduction histidine kinase